MASIVVVADAIPGGSITKLSTEIATLARALGNMAGWPVVGLVAGPSPAEAASALADYLPDVTAITGLEEALTSVPLAHELARQTSGDDIVLLPASPDGRDLAGTLSALSGLGVLANATAIRWEGGLVARHSIFGGKLITEAVFPAGTGIVTVRPNSTNAERLAAPGTVRTAEASSRPDSADGGGLRLVSRTSEAGTAAPVEDARVIVAGGRGVAGPDGFALLASLAAELGGAVGASRAAVDSGWIPYSHQIGQTGKTVKPQAYIALGISGAIQHKVGMQTAGTIIAVNRDPEAPIAEFADMLVVGDLFEVGEALLSRLQDR